MVHSVGGWAALAGTIVLGPRMGKYGKKGMIKAILGHNLPLAALGVFILFKIIDKTVGLRVSPQEELDGLDFSEHGGEAYPDFEVSTYVQR